MTSFLLFKPTRALLAASLASLAFGAVAAPAAAETIETPRRIELPPLPHFDRSIGPDALTTVGGRILFTAYDSRHGREPWQSDGTAAGTRRLADLCPGECSSHSHAEPDYHVLGDRVLFQAQNGTGWMLYSLRGNQVEPVVRLPSEIADAKVFGHFLYAVVLSGPNDYELYRSNGQPGSWELFENLCEDGVQVPYCRAPELFVHRNELYYLHQGELRKTTTSGQVTVLRQLIDARGFASLGDQALLFQAWEEGPGNLLSRLMVTDGSPAGTQPVNPDPYDATTANPDQLTYWNGVVYYTSGGGAVYRTDGTSEGTLRADWLQQGTWRNGLVAVTSGALFYSPIDQWPVRSLRAYSAAGVDTLLLTEDYLGLRFIGQLGAKALFKLSGGRFLLTDGTLAGSTFLDGWYSDALGSSGARLNGSLYVAASRQGDYTPDQLWRFAPDGTTTRLDAPIASTFETVAPYTFEPRQLLAYTSPDAGRMFRVDPDTLTVSPLGPEPLTPGAASGSTFLAAQASQPAGRYYVRVTAEAVEATPFSGYRNFIPDGEGLFYFPGAPGQKLMVTDGTAEGTRELFDFDPSWIKPPCSRHCLPDFPNAITVSGDHVYFVAATSPGSPDLALWVYDRASGESRLLFPAFVYEPTLIPFGDGKIAFQVEYGDGEGLWVSDGSAAGTRRVFTPPADLRFATPYFLEPVGERLFFNLPSQQDQLWTSDGGPGGSYVLLDPDFLRIGASAAAGDQLFFVASDLQHGDELWVTDGTAAGTRLLEIRPGPEGSLPTALHTVGDRVVFAADDGVHGHELFVSDGSAAGTLLVADLAEGPSASSPQNFAAVGERIFFQADDGANGRGLWAVDLPAAPLPACPEDRLCLLGDRFEVAMEARVGATVFPGRRARSSAESGVFSFFGPSNWEAMIKVLDGCAINQRFWVYAGAATDLPYEIRVKDRATGETRTWSSPGGRAEPILDGDAFATCSANPPEAAHVPVLPLGEPAPRCPDAPDAFCFGGGRFVARAIWQTAASGGFAHTEPYGSRDSGLFTFFSPSNWELMVKVLDGCTLNGHHWVYLAGTTDVGWELTVEDRATGAVRRYRNPSGAASPAITDGEAFTCP